MASNGTRPQNETEVGGPVRVRLTGFQRRWLVRVMYDTIWDTDLMDKSRVGTIEEMLDIGPDMSRMQLARLTDTAMAHEILGKLDYSGGREYAESWLRYLVEGPQ